MLKSQPGSFVALGHSGAYQVHRERIRGFSDYLDEHRNPGHLFCKRGKSPGTRLVMGRVTD